MIKRGNLFTLEITAILLVSAVCVHTSSAQCNMGICDSLLQAMTTSAGYGLARILSDSSLDTANLINVDDQCAHFRFEYVSDSSHVYWQFSEFLLNRKKIFLANWCPNRILNFDFVNRMAVANWPADVLSNRSTTRTISVSAGDTLQFFRNMFLSRVAQSGNVYNYYKNDATLSYSVELVDSSSGSRIVLFDTACYSTTTPSRKPCIFSWFPMYSRVRTIVPSGISKVRAFVRINTFAFGLNPDPWVRKDLYGPYMSNYSLNKPSVAAYNTKVLNNIDCSGQAFCEVNGTGLPGPPRISVLHTVPTTLDNVTVFTVYGTQVWSSSAPFSINPTNVNVPNPGLYILIGKSGPVVVCTEKVFVP